MLSDKAREALEVVVRSAVREILETEDDGPFAPLAPPHSEPPTAPFPRFDFVPEMDGPAPTAEELDDLTSEEPANPITRAARLKEKHAREKQRLFPEEIPLRGMAPPEDVP